MQRVDKVFLGLLISLIVMGVFVFISASFGVLAKNSDKFYSILFNQLVLGLGLGIIAFFITLHIPYKFWRKYSIYIFLGSLVLTALVFIPGLGFEHAGAQRWVSIGPISFQPAEFLKIGFIIYFAAWLSWVKDRVSNFKFGILPFLIFISFAAVVLLRQPDVKSFLLILISSLIMLFVSGISWKNIIGLGLVTVFGLLILIYFMPYLSGRIQTFLEPARDPRGSSYQLQQSLIAIGSGGLFGRGYGQSIQKFSYLPEPQGDSVFAVLGEELGFVGGVVLILLYIAFALRGLRIAYRSPDIFSRLLVTGIVILITAQAFLNISSITGVFPLTGVPLPFVSHGGTALATFLAAVGIILNISKSQKVKALGTRF